MEILNLFFENWIGGLILMILMSVIITKACDVFELASDYLGRNLSDGVKGATINAIGSSLPEFLTTVFFLIFYANSDIAEGFAASVGGNTGSAIFNSIFIPMLVIGVVLFTVVGIKGVYISKKVILRDGLFLIAAEILLLFLLSSDYITMWHGWVFTLFYLLYIFYTIKTMSVVETDVKSEDIKDPENWYEKYLYSGQDGRSFRATFLLIYGTLFIALASAGLVKGTEAISMDLGVNPLFIAFILVAAASSVPDTIISLKDAKKGNYDDALSNVLGSNIFDITISMGLPLAVYLMFTGTTIDFKDAGQTLIDIRILLIVVTTITFLIFFYSTSLRWPHVYTLAALYLTLIIYAISAGAYHEGVDNFFANAAGSFIEYLNKPAGISDTLRSVANSITKNW